MDDNEDIIERPFRCKICNKTHFLFSKEQVVAMMKPLLEEIDLLRTEVETLKKKLDSD